MRKDDCRLCSPYMQGQEQLASTIAETTDCCTSEVFSERRPTTLRSLYAIGRPSVCLSDCLLSVCLLSVCCLLSVTLVHPSQAVELFCNFFSPYDSSGTLLFWCQKSLVGDAPFLLKFAFKVTHSFKTTKFDKYRLIAPQPS